MIPKYPLPMGLFSPMRGLDQLGMLISPSHPVKPSDEQENTKCNPDMTPEKLGDIAERQSTPGKKSVLFATPLERHTPETEHQFHHASPTVPLGTPMFEQFQFHQSMGLSPPLQNIADGKRSTRKMEHAQDLQSLTPSLRKRDLSTPKAERAQRKAEQRKKAMSRSPASQDIHGTANRTMNSSFRLSEEQRGRVKVEISKQALRVHEISELKQLAAEHLHQGMFQLAIDTANLCHERVTETFGDKHVDCVYLKILLGEAYTHCGGGLFQLARESFFEAQRIIEMSDVESNLQLRLFTEILFTDIGYLMRLQGRFKESLEAYQKAYQLRIGQHGKKSVPVAQTLNNIALVLTSLGKFQEALNMFGEARGIRTDLLGDNHLDVATIINNMANVYLYIGKHRLALEYYFKGKNILEINRQTQHPDYATCLVNIGSAFKEMKQYEQALVMYQKAQALREQILGKDHNLTAAVYLFIGHLLLCHDFDSINRKVPQESELGYHNQPDQCISFLSPTTNRSISESRSAEEREENRHDQLQQAREYIECALNIRLRSLGLFHSETAHCYNALGHAHLKENQFDECKRCYQTAQQICAQISGEDHPETIQCEENIVNLMLIVGQKGQVALQKLLKIAAYKKKFYGSTHPCTASMYNSIGNVLRQQGRFRQARSMYEKSRVIFEKSCGFDHPSTAIIYTNIANLYRHEGRYEEALKWYLKSKSIRERLYGEDHIETLYAIKNIALVYLEQERFDIALQNLQRCKDMLLGGRLHRGKVNNSILSANSSSILDSATSRSMRYYRQGDEAGAINPLSSHSESTYPRNSASLVDLELIRLGHLIAQALRLKHQKESKDAKK